jgi:cob(I)alamin adenosyltransferase
MIKKQLTSYKLQATRRNKGMVYVFTGDGKGKTSAALGVGVRAALNGMRGAMVCWYKSKDWDVSEYKLPEKLRNFEIFPIGEGFHIRSKEYGVRGKGYKLAPLPGGGRVVDRTSKEEHRKAARAALEKAKELISKVDVLILDEVNNAVKDGLIDLVDLINLISKRGKTHLILTGRGAHKKVIAAADLVTEMKKIKHPFDKGKRAVKGLDF